MYISTAQSKASSNDVRCYMQEGESTNRKLTALCASTGASAIPLSPPFVLHTVRIGHLTDCQTIIRMRRGIRYNYNY